MFHETIEKLRRNLSMPLPGVVAQKEMAPVLIDSSRFNPSTKQDTILGGVLILLYSIGNKIMILITILFILLKTFNLPVCKSHIAY